MVSVSSPVTVSDVLPLPRGTRSPVKVYLTCTGARFTCHGTVYRNQVHLTSVNVNLSFSKLRLIPVQAHHTLVRGTSHNFQGRSHICLGICHICLGASHTCLGTSYTWQGTLNTRKSTPHNYQGTSNACQGTSHT